MESIVDQIDSKVTSRSLILIYDDLGALNHCTRELYHQICHHFPHFIIRRVNGDELLDILTRNSQDVAMICIGGGYDLGMVATLKGEQGGNLLRQYLEGGGIYYGICAGAYFATSYVQFDEGGELEVLGARFIRAIDGEAIGPVLPGFRYNSEDGAYAVKLTQTPQVNDSLSWLVSEVNCPSFHAYLNGGPYFHLTSEDKERVCIVYHYELNHEPAVIASPVGKGLAILSGVHLEVSNEYVRHNWWNPDQSNEDKKETVHPSCADNDRQSLLDQSEDKRRAFCSKLFAALQKHYFT